MERLDSLSNKKPALKFKPKVVARKSAQDRTPAIKTPTEAKPKRTDLRKLKPRPKQQHSDMVMSVGPLAQGAISLGGQRYQTPAYRGGSFVKTEPGLDYDIDPNSDGMVDINNPSITDALFPRKPPRDDEDDSPVEEETRLQEDYATIKNLLMNQDSQGDVKMEDDQEPSQPGPLPLTFLQVPKLPLETGAEGLVGRLNVHQSGKVSLHIGDIQYDLSVGGHLNAQEALWILDSEGGLCHDMGSVKARVIGTPSF